MITTLENLTEKVRENRLKNLAMNIVQYQNFKTKAIIRKIDNAGYSESTLRFYIDKGISYIKSGKIYKELGSFTNYIDEHIAYHIQPLVPSNYDRRRTIVGNKSSKTNKSILPVQKVLNKLVNTQYAVQINSTIKICSSIEYAQAFKEGLMFMGCNDSKIVKINIEEYND